ncbi:MAG: thiolase family protein [Sandaracinaceae bacterium]|nr:thiolase family protein [Sandaracinaceae bacterium]
MSAREVWICSAVRTPIGAFQGVLQEVSAPELGARAIRAAVERAGLGPDEIDEVFMGNVLSAGLGQAPARQAARRAGLPDRVPATTVSKVCGSGMQAVILGARAILLGDAEIVVAGGMESMSQAPYLLPNARKGMRMGHGQVIDSMIHDGLWDPYRNWHMGNAGELCARELRISREEQDAYAESSYRRALRAQEAGEFCKEIVPVSVEGKGGPSLVSEDEEPKRVQFAKIPTLRPVFEKEGTITAANASKINDGASALVLASGEAVHARKLEPLARLVAYGGHAQAPEWFTTAPAKAMQAACARAGLGVADIDLFEINEAFAVVALAAIRELNLDPERVNVWGGAIALGHPIGASGARILTTLIHALQRFEKKRGLASLCIGGGEALAVLVERPD